LKEVSKSKHWTLCFILISLISTDPSEEDINDKQDDSPPAVFSSYSQSAVFESEDNPERVIHLTSLLFFDIQHSQIEEVNYDEATIVLQTSKGYSIKTKQRKARISRSGGMTTRFVFYLY